MQKKSYARNNILIAGIYRSEYKWNPTCFWNKLTLFGWSLGEALKLFYEIKCECFSCTTLHVLYWRQLTIYMSLYLLQHFDKYSTSQVATIYWCGLVSFYSSSRSKGMYTSIDYLNTLTNNESFTFDPPYGSAYENQSKLIWQNAYIGEEI